MLKAIPILLLCLFLAIQQTTSVRAQPRPTVALVLTGGGARGLAQIGVIREFARQGIHFDVVIGSSIGAVIGGLYSAGYTPDELDSIFRSINWEKATSLQDDARRETMFYAQKAEGDRSLFKLRFRDFSFLPPESLGGSAGFASILQELLWQAPYNTTTDFDLLQRRFRAVATSLNNGQWIALRNGNLATAIQASATFPLRYAPVRIDTNVLVDGGLVANIPTEAAKEFSPDVIVVVNTVSTYVPHTELVDVLDVADQALNAAMKQADSAHLALADEVVTPDLSGITTFDFDKVSETIQQGEQAARQAAPRIRETIHRARIRKMQSDSLLTSQRVADSILMNTLVMAVDAPSSLPLSRSEAVSTVLNSMIGRSWSDAFARSFGADLLRAMRREHWQFAYIRAMAYDSANKSVTMVVDPGHLNNVRIDAQRPVQYRDVIREFTIEPGDEITVAHLREISNRLRSSELFANVTLAVVPASDSGLDIVVGAADRGNQLLKIGARVDNERYAQAGFDFIHQNLGNTDLRTGIRGVISPRIGEAQLNFEMPRILGSLWTAGLRGYASFRNVWIYRRTASSTRTFVDRERIDEFSEDRIGARLSAGRQLERNGVILGELRYEFQRYRDINATSNTPLQPIATVRGLIRWDDRDKIGFTRSGRVIDLSMETSLFSIGNGVTFTKAFAYLSTTVPISTLTLTPSVLVGAADKTLPFPELFSLGGQDMFFGMREDEVRGRQVVVSNVEVRYRLPFDVLFPTYASIRYDLGAIWQEPEQIKFSAFQHGIGVTLGLDSPIGPVNLSVGRRFFFLSDPPSVAWGPFLGYFAFGVRL